MRQSGCVVKGRVSFGSYEKGGKMNNEKTLYPVRNYKDTVFRKLFSEKKKLLNLYNAVNGTHYPNEEDFEIITLDNAIYMSMKNDIAFLMDFQMHLYEHQSTVNPNMPLRFLQYTAKEYEKLIDGKRLYKSRRVKIPAPQYIVFYNGVKPQPEEQVLKLSDSYIKKQENPSLELKVRFLNINQGKNAEIVEQCKELKEYMLYVDRVRKYLADMDLEKAVARAVDECIKEGILAEFLRENKAEVISMSILECDFEDIKEAVYEDAWEIGMEEGREVGLAEGRAEGHAEGLVEGGIVTLILDNLEDGKSEEQILGKLEKRFGLSKEVAKEYIEKYSAMAG